MERTILITGANGNLGREVVKLLSAEGYKIIAVAGHGEITESLKQHAIRVDHVDLLDEKSSEIFVQSMIDEYPQLEAAVLLAGGFEMGNLEKTDENLLDKQIALNFKTAWFVVKPFMTHFKKKGAGQIILIGSRPAINPKDGKNSIAYALSKSLLFRLAEIINDSGKDHGITASVIVPSILDTPPNRVDMPDADFDAWVKTSTVAETISFILSDAGKELRQPVFKIYDRS
ncbi:MAG TPA: SDR family NAD(P)-dependent oxidoreductase [Saprospiraceae bacterium]|nr:SDR family NAD(P)-dependent oxidoreductase [Saprospiraceae bacterium]